MSAQYSTGTIQDTTTKSSRAALHTYIYIYNDSFFEGTGIWKEFFSSQPQHGILETGISPSNRFVRAPPSGGGVAALRAPDTRHGREGDQRCEVTVQTSTAWRVHCVQRRSSRRKGSPLYQCRYAKECPRQRDPSSVTWKTLTDRQSVGGFRARHLYLGISLSGSSDMIGI